MPNVVRVEIARRSEKLTLLLLFAGLALFPAALGVYALVAHSVARRHMELAIRISLGADAGTIWSAVMRQALIPVIAGLVSGLTTAVLTGPLLRSLLFEVNPTNPAVLAAAVATVGIAAVCACLGPAYRPTRPDPLRALRAD